MAFTGQFLQREAAPPIWAAIVWPWLALSPRRELAGTEKLQMFIAATIPSPPRMILSKGP